MPHSYPGDYDLNKNLNLYYLRNFLNKLEHSLPKTFFFLNLLDIFHPTPGHHDLKNLNLYYLMMLSHNFQPFLPTFLKDHSSYTCVKLDPPLWLHLAYRDWRNLNLYYQRMLPDKELFWKNCFLLRRLLKNTICFSIVL